MLFWPILVVKKRSDLEAFAVPLANNMEAIWAATLSQTELHTYTHTHTLPAFGAEWFIPKGVGIDYNVNDHARHITRFRFTFTFLSLDLEIILHKI